MLLTLFSLGVQDGARFGGPIWAIFEFEMLDGGRCCLSDILVLEQLTATKCSSCIQNIVMWQRRRISSAWRDATNGCDERRHIFKREPWFHNVKNQDSLDLVRNSKMDDVRVKEGRSFGAREGLWHLPLRSKMAWLTASKTTKRRTLASKVWI